MTINDNAASSGTAASSIPIPTAAQNGESNNTFLVKAGLAQMLKGGVIMDVVNAEQARIAEEAGACAVMALERVPADIRKDGGVARMSDPELIKGEPLPRDHICTETNHIQAFKRQSQSLLWPKHVLVTLSNARSSKH